MDDLFRNNITFRTKGSIIWRSHIKILPWWRMRIEWEFGNGWKILIGSDNIKGLNREQNLQGHYLDIINKKGYFFLGQTIISYQNRCLVERSYRNGLTRQCATEWREFTTSLSNTGLFHNTLGENISWSGKMHKQATMVAKEYIYYITQRYNLKQTSWFCIVCKLKIPHKLTLLPWLVWKNKVLTYKTLLKRGFHGPGFCTFCRNSIEST